MKIKLIDLMSNQANLKELQELELPTKVSYRIKRFIDKTNPIVKNYSDSLNELITKFSNGDKDEKGQPMVKSDSPKMKELNDENEKLLEMEEEVDFEKISIEEVTKGKVTIKPKLLLDFLFVE